MVMSVNLTTDVTITSQPICASYQDMALCGLIAATNIGQLYSAWSCTTDGRTRTNPCSLNNDNWGGLNCFGGNVVSIMLSNLDGIFYLK